MPQIRVNEKVHQKVAKIAEANFRGMGDQVAFWAAKSCEHPVDQREPAQVTLAPVVSGKVGVNHVLSAFYCQKCGQFVVTQADPDLVEDLDDAVSA